MFRYDRLVDLRKEKKLTQKVMAERMGMSRGGYSLYESGHRQPTIDALERIADIFHVSTDYLLGRDEYGINYDVSPLPDFEQKKIRLKIDKYSTSNFEDEHNEND